MIASYVSLFEDILALDVKQQLGSAYDVHVCLASTVQQGAEMLAFRRMNLSEKLATTFSNKVQEFLADYAKMWINGGRILYPYGGENRPQEHEVEHLRADAEGYAFLQQQVAPLQAYQDFLFFQDDDKTFTNNIRFYVIIIKPLSKPQEAIYFYRYYTRRQLLRQSRFIGAIFRDTNEYDLVEEPTLLFDDTIDCISRGNDFFILKQDNFHSIFRFLEEVEKTVGAALTTIQTQLGREKMPIEGYDNFALDCKKNRLKMNMLTSIAKKPYLKDLTPARMQGVVSRLGRDILGDAFVTTFEKEQKLLYDTKYPWVLLKLLNDSYLWSEMTSLGYDVSDKREL